jgi:hypothetical protein
MRHGIKPEEWIEFNEGTLDGPRQARIEAHLEACAECRQTRDDLNLWRGRLRDEGKRLREALTLEPSQVERMLAETLERVAVPRRGAADSVLLLRSLLDPVFGPGAMRAAVEAAMRRVSPEGVTAATWKAFVDGFAENIKSMCGLAAGRLAGRAGLSLGVSLAIEDA